MHCYLHRSSPAVATCVRCGNFVCAVCDVEAGGQHYCKGCLRHGGPPTPSGARRFLRSRHDRMVFGVCGGLARYFGLDPTLTRVLFALAAVLTGLVPFAIAYVVLAIITPTEEALW
jgi:phage shock protein PspC (stress-responsive transcriptional regulator)